MDMAAADQEATASQKLNERQHTDKSIQNSSDSVVEESDVGVLPGEMGELKRVQLANEGMKLLLTSEIKAAEELFRASRSASVYFYGVGEGSMEAVVSSVWTYSI